MRGHFFEEEHLKAARTKHFPALTSSALTSHCTQTMNLLRLQYSDILFKECTNGYLNKLLITELGHDTHFAQRIYGIPCI